MCRALQGQITQIRAECSALDVDNQRLRERLAAACSDLELEEKATDMLVIERDDLQEKLDEIMATSIYGELEKELGNA